jgi:chromosome segregation ATPase
MAAKIQTMEDKPVGNDLDNSTRTIQALELKNTELKLKIEHLDGSVVVIKGKQDKIVENAQKVENLKATLKEHKEDVKTMVAKSQTLEDKLVGNDLDNCTRTIQSSLELKNTELELKIEHLDGSVVEIKGKQDQIVENAQKVENLKESLQEHKEDVKTMFAKIQTLEEVDLQRLKENNTDLSLRLSYLEGKGTQKCKKQILKQVIVYPSLYIYWPFRY